MSILLPSAPGFRAGKPRLLDFGATLTPPGGGAAQRLNRIGNRFALDVEVGTSRADVAGRVLASRLMQALTQGALYPFPQDLNPGAVGSGVTVNGGGQTGSTLSLRGFPAGYQVREGQFLSLVHNGRRYLHAAAADGAADGNGGLVLPIVPMLRISPGDGEIAEFAQPMIEASCPATRSSGPFKPRPTSMPASPSRRRPE